MSFSLAQLEINQNKKSFVNAEYVNTFKTVAKDEKKSGRSSAGSKAANHSSATIIQNTDLIGGDYERSRNSV